jgi:hypothetical protein
MPLHEKSLEQLSDKDLAEERDRILRDVERGNPINAASQILRVQIYIQELAARKQRELVEEQRRQARLMVRCTVVMTVLTVLIAIMTATLLWKTFFPA